MRLTHLFIFLFSARLAVYLVKVVADWLQTSPQTVMVEYTVVALCLWNRGLFWVALGGVVAFEALRRFVPSRRVALAALTFSPGGAGRLLAAPFSPTPPPMADPGRARPLPRNSRQTTARTTKYAGHRRHTPKDALFYCGWPCSVTRARRHHPQPGQPDQPPGQQAWPLPPLPGPRRQPTPTLNLLCREAPGIERGFKLYLKERPVRLDLL